MSKRRFPAGFEEFAVRVMYFMTTIDSYVPMAGTAAWLIMTAWFGVWNWTWWLAVSFGLTWTAFRLADYYPTFVAILPLWSITLVPSGGVGAIQAGVLMALCLLFGVATQALFQGIPHVVASRDRSVWWRMLASSTRSLAPTTLSLPVPWLFSSLLALNLAATPAVPGPWYAANYLSLLFGAVLVRLMAPRTYIPEPYHPQPERPICRRVILLNIDGLSWYWFRRANMPFLHRLMKRHAWAPRGAITVYRALTNPAFASILTGAPPAVHGIRNNNLGQRLTIDALPDLVPSKLYGSVHMKHFSKPSWEVQWYSLVELGAQATEERLFGQLRRDVAERPELRLFIADVSEVDFTGHSYGSYSRAYREAAARTDAHIRDFYTWLQESGHLEDCTVIVSSDHGLWINDHSYLLSEQEKYTPLLFLGPGVRRCCLGGQPSIMDINANISYLLGLRYNEHSRGRVYPQAFRCPRPSPVLAQETGDGVTG
jgi:Type I phosphodiesterase / nucleotide pyrophosphatase